MDKTVNKNQVKKFSQEEVDQLIQERLARKGRQQLKISKALAQREADIVKKEIAIEALIEIEKSKLPVEVLDLVLREDLEQTKRNIEVLHEIIKKEVRNFAQQMITTYYH